MQDGGKRERRNDLSLSYFLFSILTLLFFFLIFGLSKSRNKYDIIHDHYNSNSNMTRFDDYYRLVICDISEE